MKATQIETLEAYLLESHRDQTAKSYQYHIGVFLMEHPKAENYTYQQIISYLNTVKTNKQIRLASLKRYYDYLLEIGQRNDHPCKYVKLKDKHKPIQVQNLFSSTELELLLDRENRFNNLDVRNKVAISLLIYQALTSEELMNLRTRDVDLDEGTIYIRRGAKQSARTLPLRTKQIKLFYTYMYESRKALVQTSVDELLISIRGVKMSVDGIHSMIQPLQALYPDRALNPQTIRQSVICNLLNERKEPIEDVQMFAGHRWPSTTERYKRMDLENQLEEINKWHPLG